MLEDSPVETLNRTNDLSSFVLASSSLNDFQALYVHSSHLFTQSALSLVSKSFDNL